MSTAEANSETTTIATIAKFDTNAAVAAYDKFNAQVEEIQKLGELTVANNGIKEVESAHKLVKQIRAGVTSTHKELKAGCNAYANTVDSIKRQLVAKIEVIEGKLKKEREVFEAAEEEAKRLKEVERMAVIQARINKCNGLSIAFDLVELQGMTDGDFEMWFTNREAEAIERMAQIAEEARIAKEFEEKQRAERDAEAARLRAEMEEIQRQQAEELKIRAEELEIQRKADEIKRLQREAEFAERERLAAELLEKQRLEHLALMEKQRLEKEVADQIIREREQAAQKVADAIRDRADAIRDRERAEQKAEADRLEAERKAIQAERDEIQRQKDAAEKTRIEQELAAEAARHMELAASELEKLTSVISKKTIEDRLVGLGNPWWGPELIRRLSVLVADMRFFVSEGEDST